MDYNYPHPDFCKYPDGITGEDPQARQARLNAYRQHAIDEMSCIFGTPVKHSAIDAAKGLPNILSPYTSTHEPIVGIDRIFGDYLNAQAAIYMMRLTGLALANRIERAERVIKDQLRQQYSGANYIPNSEPVDKRQLELFIAKQNMDAFQDVLKKAENEEEYKKQAYVQAMKTCAERIAEQISRT